VLFIIWYTEPQTRVRFSLLPSNCSWCCTCTLVADFSSLSAFLSSTRLFSVGHGIRCFHHPRLHRLDCHLTSRNRLPPLVVFASAVSSNRMRNRLSLLVVFDADTAAGCQLRIRRRHSIRRARRCRCSGSIRPCTPPPLFRFNLGSICFIVLARLSCASARLGCGSARFRGESAQISLVKKKRGLLVSVGLFSMTIHLSYLTTNRQ
jgi:hypothetical protein